jgi:hypothetical protein
MRRRLEEPRQVRKEAAVFAIVVCCGVPGLFFVPFFPISSGLLKIVNGFRLPLNEKVHK